MIHYGQNDDPRRTGYVDANAERGLAPKPTYEELEADVKALRARVMLLEDEVTVQADCPPPSTHRALLQRIKELNDMLCKSASERERELLNEVDRLTKRADEWMRKWNAQQSAVASRERDLVRLQAVYEELCERADMPKPPCPHGRDASRCLNCVASWLGREGIMPEARRHGGSAKR